MSSPIFAMSLDTYSPFYTSHSTSSRNYSSRNNRMEKDHFEDAPVYIRGFPGYNVNGTDSNDIYNPYQQARLNLQDYKGASDLDDLVDRLQLRDDSNDTFATRRPPNNNNNLYAQKSTKRSVSTELPTLFISIFHTQFCQSNKKLRSNTYQDCFKRFFIMYMRNWDSLMEFKRCELTFIKDFKQKQHERLNKDEWNYLCNFVKRIDNDLSTNKPFQEFCTLLRTRSLSSSPSNSFGTDSSTSLSWLSRSLMLVQSNSHNSISNSPSSTSEEEEIKRLYICIYFLNYQEFWNSDTFVLSGTMMKSVESYLESYPTIDSEIFNSLIQSLDKPLL